jgi:hypothetical protein
MGVVSKQYFINEFMVSVWHYFKAIFLPLKPHTAPCKPSIPRSIPRSHFVNVLYVNLLSSPYNSPNKFKVLVTMSFYTTRSILVPTTTPFTKKDNMKLKKPIIKHYANVRKHCLARNWQKVHW